MEDIQAILFDFGGVFTYSPFGAVESYAEGIGAEPRQVGQLVFGDYYRDTDHPWHRLERGEISMEDARQAITDLGRKEGLELDLYKVFASFPADGGLRHEMVDKARSLREDGYQLAVVTNNVAEFRDGWRSMLPVDDIFHAVVDSSVEGMRKPDPAIYQLALGCLGGIAPQRAVFLDDFDGNLHAANALGMRTVLVGAEAAPALAALDAHLSGAKPSAGTAPVVSH